jgi:hypothetical protein
MPCFALCRFEFEFRLARATPLALTGTTYDDGNAFSVIPIEDSTNWCLLLLLVVEAKGAHRGV